MTIPRKRARRRIPASERYAGLADMPGAQVPRPVRERKRKEDAAPEAELQHSVNELLKRARRFQFRLSERTLERAGDWRVSGWPDSPMIIPLPYGVALFGGLELKREGEVMNPEQIALAPLINTQCTDKWDEAERYVHHVGWMAEYVRHLLERFPPCSPYLSYGPGGKTSPLPPRC